MSRRTHRERRRGGAVHQLPWQQLRNPFPPARILSDDQVQTIIEAALSVLENNGMRFLEGESRKILRQAGAMVDETSQMLRFDRAMVRELLAHAPASFPLRARNPERDLVVGGDHVIFGSVGGPAFCSDLEKGRRPGTYAEMCDFFRIVQSLNIIHQEGGCCFEPMDLPPESRHLDLYLAQLTLLDKNAQGYPLGRYRTVDCLEMTAIALGTDRDGLKEVSNGAYGIAEGEYRRILG